MKILNKNEIKNIFGGVLTAPCATDISIQIRQLLLGVLTPVEMSHRIPALPCSRQEITEAFKLLKHPFLTASICVNDPEACDA